MEKSCPECGYPLSGKERSCPECGFPLQNDAYYVAENSTYHEIGNKNQSVEIAGAMQSAATNTIRISDNDCYQTFSELFWNCQFYKIVKGKHFDLGQRIYEFGVFLWEMITLTWHTMWKNYAKFNGRSSRREYWSFWWGLSFLIFISFGLFALIGLIPAIAVCIRRMHDINKCGWWSCVPIVCFFLFLKKSDEGENRYGMPNPAKNMIY